MVAKPPGVHCETVPSLARRFSKIPMINCSKSLLDSESTILAFLIIWIFDMHTSVKLLYILNKEIYILSIKNLPANKEIKLPANKNMHVYNYLKVHFLLFD